MSKEYTITKRFTKKVSFNYNSLECSTELSHIVNVASGDELLAESEKLFEQAKTLTNNDIQKVLIENGVTK
jgi:hypothetical protein